MVDKLYLNKAIKKYIYPYINTCADAHYKGMHQNINKVFICKKKKHHSLKI